MAIAAKLYLVCLGLAVVVFALFPAPNIYPVEVRPVVYERETITQVPVEVDPAMVVVNAQLIQALSQRITVIEKAGDVSVVDAKVTALKAQVAKTDAKSASKHTTFATVIVFLAFAWSILAFSTFLHVQRSKR